MPGFLTSLFDDDGHSPSVVVDQPTASVATGDGQPEDNGGSSSQHPGGEGSDNAGQNGAQGASDTSTVAGHQDTGLAVDVGLGISGSYVNADGGTTDWSHTNDVGADLDTNVLINTTTTLAEGGASDSL